MFTLCYYAAIVLQLNVYYAAINLSFNYTYLFCLTTLCVSNRPSVGEIIVLGGKHGRKSMSLDDI